MAAIETTVSHLPTVLKFISEKQNEKNH